MDQGSYLVKVVPRILIITARENHASNEIVVMPILSATILLVVVDINLPVI